MTRALHTLSAQRLLLAPDSPAGAVAAGVFAGIFDDGFSFVGTCFWGLGSSWPGERDVTEEVAREYGRCPGGHMIPEPLTIFVEEDEGLHGGVGKCDADD